MNLIGAILSMAIFCFNGYLVCFHIYLKMKGLTSYQYLTFKSALAQTKMMKIKINSIRPFDPEDSL